MKFELKYNDLKEKISKTMLIKYIFKDNKFVIKFNKMFV